MPTRFVTLVLLGWAWGCAHGPGPEQTLPQLRAAIESPVESPDQNARNSALVEQVTNDKQIQGLTREDLAARLGRGEPCQRHPLCHDKGFDDGDWYYEVGREGGSYLRGRPALIVGFSRFGKVERTFVLRAPD
ncbi:MAG: hypothetical protein RLZZ450_4713 [Pseudomonadota bacterium]